MLTAKKIKVFLGPVVALLILLGTDLDPSNPLVTRMAALAAWMAIWWLTEAVHLTITALLPVVFIPMLGIGDAAMVATQYMDPIIFLFIGGFIIAFAIERWNLHQRISLKILSMVGAKPAGILMGVMSASYFISMWISNTATVMMLLSSVMAVIYQLEKHGDENGFVQKLSTALLIGLAYSASIGGIATLVGTPTNMIFFREYTKAFPNNHDMDFANWFIIGFPVSIGLLFLSFIVLKYLFLKNVKSISVDKNHFKNKLKELGPMSYEEKVTGSVFILTAILWFTRVDIDMGAIKIPGWSNLFKNPAYIHDGTVAIVMALVLFLFPTKNEKSRGILIWEDVHKLPFDIVLLFGGGFALAKGLEVSGMSAWMATGINLSGIPSYFLLMIVMCSLICVISEFASNVACIQLMIPLLIAVLPSTGLHPLLLLVPATLASSLGFMLPVATAPNTIVFGSKRITVNQMMKAGILVDILGIILMSVSMVVYKYFF